MRGQTVQRDKPEKPGESNVLSEPKRVEGFVYILQCADDSFYVGRTQDIKQRLADHNAGRGARWMAARLPARLVYQEQLATEAEAVLREKQLKKWSRDKKAALIAGEPVRLSLLSAGGNRQAG